MPDAMYEEGWTSTQKEEPMEKMELLWAYMQEDMKADRLLNDIKRSPLRQKLEKTRDFIMDQQKNYKMMEEQVAVLADRKDAIRDAIGRCSDQVKSLKERVSAAPPQNLEDAQALVGEAEKIRRTILSYESEMNRIQKKSVDYASRIKNIRMSTAKAKQEFDQMKVEYEKESREKKTLVAAQRTVAAGKAQGIPEDLMSEYNAIKKHITPPMARLIGDACSGCNTSQPSALLRKIETAQEIVECETCGRMLIK